MILQGVILFHTTSNVMRTEKLLLKAGYCIKLIPTPREFSSDCGIAIRFNWELYEKVKLILAQEKIEFAAINQLILK